MPSICHTCQRVNPAEAVYCYFDGSALAGARAGGPVSVGTQLFRSTFVFPSGHPCRTFDELALACQHDWQVSCDLLRRGQFETFFTSLGRGDLAQVARAAARYPDTDRGLDQLLAKLPTKALESPQLVVEPPAVNLGVLGRGQDRRFRLRLRNIGMRLLHGTASCADHVWLAVGDAPAGPRKLLQFRDEFALPVQVIGKQLRAGNKPVEGQIVFETNGGTVVVPVQANVPVKPFPEGALAGATSPRQIAEKARAAPRDAAALFESGAVERWYRDNGWTYPVQGPSASGIGAVQQFFEALGLTSPPKVEISDRAINLRGFPGDRLEHLLKLWTEEKRPIYAHATTDQAWLKIGRAALDGRSATLPVVVPEVPQRPGEKLLGRVTVTANGNQRFWVAVTLLVGNRPPVRAPATLHSVGASALATMQAPLPPAALPVADVAEDFVPVLPPAATVPGAAFGVELLPAAPEAPPAPVAPVERRGGWPGWAHLIPVVLLALVLGGVTLRDYFLKGSPPAQPEVLLIDAEPRLGVGFHDGPKGDEGDKAMPNPTMRFGLVMLRERDPKDPNKEKRLTYDKWGRTNNTCLRIDGQELIFGHPVGQPPAEFTEQLTKLGKDTSGLVGEGWRTVWRLPREQVQVTQLVEIVAGEQSRLLDTCRVRYLIENQDSKPHTVGIRFLLDTFIGANDGVPFLLPGTPGLCDTMREFATPSEVPDFLQAQENEDLQHPGTVAQVQFRLGGRVEAPARVTLGAWPDGRLKDLGVTGAEAQMTKWQVPVLPIKTITERLRVPGKFAPPDSAVVLYWDEKPLGPGEKREVGFAYGLGSVSANEGGGRLALTAGGSLVAGREFTLTALVSNPEPGEALTVELPEGFSLVEGEREQKVPPVAADAARRNSPVTWKIKAGPRGEHVLKVRSSKGAAQTLTVYVRQKGVFD